MTEAQKRANKKYIAKQAEIKIRTTTEMKKLIQETAERENKSVNELIIQLIKNYIESIY